MLNKAWLYLIIIGVIVLIAAIGWEIFQVSTGARSSFTYSVTKFTQKELVNSKLSDNLNQNEESQ